MDKHNNTLTNVIRNRTQEKPPHRRHIIHVHGAWQWPPRCCDNCGGTEAVKDVTKCKRLCKPCRVKRERAYGG